jgi:CRISPR-associated protein Cmr2
MKHLFLFTIGPVQSFIAQARKVQDLAAGSKMLSDLTKKAMCYTKEKAKGEIIFPFFDENVHSSDYPNRFVAFIKHEDAQSFGEELEKYVLEEFKTDAGNKVKEYFDDEKLEYAISQLDDLLDIYWVALPDIDKENYTKEKYLEIERLLGGIKNLRKFKQFAEKGRKCSVNGEYNVTIYLRDKTKELPYWLSYTKNVTVKTNIEQKYLAKGEGLSTISFYKRLYDTGKSYDATCEIAYKYALDKIEGCNTDISDTIEQLKNIDEQYLYEDAEISREDKKQKLNIQNLQKQIDKALKRHNLKLGKYYAVLVFDADHMGKWLGGKHTNSQDFYKYQNKLSKLLREFANYARCCIIGNKGLTIYAGGDDYLGLIPLEYLFDILKELHKMFKVLISNRIENKNKNKELTFSAGVAIAHYKTPLGYVLNEARDAEHTAKEEGERNSLAITVLKRSGEIHKTYTKWFDNEFLPEQLFEIIKTLRSKESSNKFITNFTREFSIVEKETINKELLKAELTRLLKDNKVDKLENAVFALFAHYDKRNLKEFIGMLNIADFISRNINKIEN